MDVPVKNTLRSVAYWLVCIVLSIYLMGSLSFLLVPITWSLFFSFALLPLCNYLEEKRFPRVLAIILSISVLTLIAAVALYAMLQQMMGLLEEAPVMGRKLDDYFSQVQSLLARFMGVSDVQRMWDPLDMVDRQQVNLLVRATAHMLANIAIIPIFTFFFIYYKDFFSAFIDKLRLETGAKLKGWTGEITRVIQGYLTGMLTVTAVVSLLAAMVFYLLGVKYYLLFALFIAVFNLIPYVGVVLSSVITILYVFLTTDSLVYPVLTLLLLWLIQFVENNFITPVLVGSRIRLNPPSVIIAILIGGSVWGISGMVLFIPLLGVLKIIFDQSDTLSPYGYLLGVDVPISERKENFVKLLRRKWQKSP